MSRAYFDVAKLTQPKTYTTWLSCDSENARNGRDIMILKTHSMKCRLQQLYFKVKDTPRLTLAGFMKKFIEKYPNEYSSVRSMRGSVFLPLFKNNSLIKSYLWYSKLPKIVVELEIYVKEKRWKNT
jgi:hypothetical protein